MGKYIARRTSEDGWVIISQYQIYYDDIMMTLSIEIGKYNARRKSEDGWVIISAFKYMTMALWCFKYSNG